MTEVCGLKKTVLFFKNLVRRVVWFFKWDPWVNRSWSQEGEDRVLERIFEGRPLGFYIDIGAHHPMRFSNTYLFYKKGWRGINIDAMPGSMDAFRKSRPRDTNIELGVARDEGTLDYFIFNEPALNGFSQELSNSRSSANGTYKVIDVKKVKVLPLSKILEENSCEGKVIDFMSVDVEGLDFEVLSSNDWSRFRPTYVLAEMLGSSLSDLEHDEVALLMRKNGYEVFAKCMNTVFFKDSQGDLAGRETPENKYAD